MNRRLRFTIPLVMMIALPSCSVWDFIKPSSGISVDTEIVAGDKAINTEVSGKKEITNNTAESISQEYTTINESDNYIPWIIALIGFLLPTPTRMYYLWKNRRKK